MSTPGSRATTIGFTVMLVSVSTAMHLGADALALLLCFVGLLIGTTLVAVGFRMADGPAAIVPMTRARALAAFLRRNIDSAGLVIASCAIAALPGEEDPVLCFVMLALLLLGLILVNIGTRGE